MFDMKKTGEKILYLRKKKGITQNVLADALGISSQAVSKWEHGETMPDISKLKELSEILDSSIDYILGDGPVEDGALCCEETDTVALSDLEMLKSVYDRDNVAMFCEMLELMDKKTVSEMFRIAYEDGRRIYVAEMVDHVPQKEIMNCALYAYAHNDIGIFSEISDSLSAQNKQILKKKTIEDGRSDFLNELFA